MNEPRNNPKLLSPEESFTRRMWAIRQWGFAEDISRDQLAGEILDGLENVVLMPARERQQAIFWLRGSIPPLDAEDSQEPGTNIEDDTEDIEDDRDWLYQPLPDDSHIDRFTYLVDTSRETLENIELFAELFFMLEPEERRRRWESLHRHCQQESAPRARLEGLKPGLDMPKIPEGDKPLGKDLPQPHAHLLQAIYATFPLRPGPRLIEMERFRDSARKITDVDWPAEIESFRRSMPEVAAAGEPLLELMLASDSTSTDVFASAVESSDLESLLGDKPMKQKIGHGAKPSQPLDDEQPTHDGEPSAPDMSGEKEKANDPEEPASSPLADNASKFAEKASQTDNETSTLAKQLLGSAQVADKFDEDPAESKAGRYNDSLSKQIMAESVVPTIGKRRSSKQGLFFVFIMMIAILLIVIILHFDKLKEMMNTESKLHRPATIEKPVDVIPHDRSIVRIYIGR